MNRPSCLGTVGCVDRSWKHRCLDHSGQGHGPVPSRISYRFSPFSVFFHRPEVAALRLSSTTRLPQAVRPGFLKPLLFAPGDEDHALPETITRTFPVYLERRMNLGGMEGRAANSAWTIEDVSGWMISEAELLESDGQGPGPGIFSGRPGPRTPMLCEKTQNRAVFFLIAQNKKYRLYYPTKRGPNP